MPERARHDQLWVIYPIHSVSNGVVFANSRSLLSWGGDVLRDSSSLEIHLTLIKRAITNSWRIPTSARDPTLGGLRGWRWEWESPPERPHSIQDLLPGFTTCRAGAPSRVNCTRSRERPPKGYFHCGRGVREDGAFWMKMWVSSRETPSPGWGVPTPRVASHLRSVDSGTRAATGTSISSAAQQPSSRACCANSMTVTRLPPRPFSQLRRPSLTSRTRRK